MDKNVIREELYELTFNPSELSDENMRRTLDTIKILLKLTLNANKNNFVYVSFGSINVNKKKD